MFYLKTTSVLLRKSDRSAFTLIEVMVVVIVIAIVSASMVPALQGPARRVRLDSAARQIGELMNTCYFNACSTGRVHGLIFMADNRSFELVAEPLPDPDEPEEFQDAHLEPIHLPGLTDIVLPEGIELQSVSAFADDLMVDEDDRIRILFFPDGTTEFASLYIGYEEGARRRIRLNGLSGTIRISDPDMEELDE